MSPIEKKKEGEEFDIKNALHPLISDHNITLIIWKKRSENHFNVHKIGHTNY